MQSTLNDVNAEVISVLPNKIKIKINNLENFQLAEERFSVGSYLRVSDMQECAIIALVENFIIEKDTGIDERKYIVEAVPIGFLDQEGNFTRGGNKIAIPPSGVKPARREDIQNIYNQIDENKRFTFSQLVQDDKIDVAVDGDVFFSKHIAIVGSTGSGKSHTVAKIFQKATEAKKDGYEGLNNSHIVVFDIHSEYKSAFPDANYIDSNSLLLPYWLMNSEELEELFIDTESNDHNQRNAFKEAVVLNKKMYNASSPKKLDEKYITYDAPLFFDINEVLNYISNRNKEKEKDGEVTWKTSEGSTTIKKKPWELFGENLEFEGNKTNTLNGKLTNFLSRLENKTNDPRLMFLLGQQARDLTFEDTLKQILGYSYEEKENANVTIIDLSGVPFEVLSITVSLISRILFDYGYFFKKHNKASRCETPLMLVYEEAHKYVPRVEEAKYNSSRKAIERIAKEGRKYGVTLAIVSQRPSEVSETIFSQCNNFVAMRLTNPQDQNYVKRLLPDNLGPLTDSLPILGCGEAILIGDAIIMPSLVKIQKCDEGKGPLSSSIDYLQEWKNPWLEVEFDSLKAKWLR